MLSHWRSGFSSRGLELSFMSSTLEKSFRFNCACCNPQFPMERKFRMKSFVDNLKLFEATPSLLFLIHSILTLNQTFQCSVEISGISIISVQYDQILHLAYLFLSYFCLNNHQRIFFTFYSNQAHSYPCFLLYNK
jgi:hypothetical protein